MTRFALIALLLAGCESRKPEVGGFASFRFSSTTRRSVKSGRCDPHTAASDGRQMTWCTQVTPVKLAGRTANIDLYFLGPPTDLDARLVEITVQVSGCDELELDKYMRQTYGKPVGTQGAGAYFQNSFLWAAAYMPLKPGRCMIRLLPLSEVAEIKFIQAKDAGS